MPKRKRGRTNSATNSANNRESVTLADVKPSGHVKNKNQTKHLLKIQDRSGNKKEKIERRSGKKVKIVCENEKINTPSLSHNLNNTKSPKDEEEMSPSKAPSSTNANRLELSTGARPKSALQQAFLSRLAGSRFRELNEELYTTNSSEAFERFQSNPELFNQYHEGFRTQVKSWPVNPVDAVYRWILSVYKKRSLKDNSKRNSQLVVADFGCGDAKLAQKLLKIKQEEGRTSNKNNKEDKLVKCPFCVHSFDLVANGNEHIIPCDMANVPLKGGTVDVAVFVLALMGTNIADFIREAHRVLRPDGILKIAEVRSRFESASTSDGDQSRDLNGKGGGGGGKTNWKSSDKKNTDDSLLNEFLNVMLKLGFKCAQKDRNNKMFILLEFEKTGRKPSKDASFTAKPCIYKRR